MWTCSHVPYIRLTVPLCVSHPIPALATDLSLRHWRMPCSMTRYAYAVEGYDTSSYMMELVSINEKWYIFKADSYQSEKKPEPPNFGKPRKLEYGDGGDTTSLFVEDGGAWLIVVYDGGWITVRAFFSDLKWYEEKLSAIKAQYPEKEEVKDDLVPISLTFNTQNG